jgi:hypothetical protein
MSNIIQSPVPLILKVFKFGEELSVHDLRYYNLAYETWKNTWGNVYTQEMHLNTKLYSNDFTRQDFVVALFQGYQCVGLAFMRNVHFDRLATKEDGYFRFWPRETLDEIEKEKENIIVASFFTISPQFRKGETIEWKTLFLSLYLDFFSTLRIPIMVTAARKVKSNEKLCYGLGAICIKKDVPYRNEQGQSIDGDADLLYWREEVTFSLKNNYLQSLREEIWTKFIKVNSYAKRNAA